MLVADRLVPFVFLRFCVVAVLGGWTPSGGRCACAVIVLPWSTVKGAFFVLFSDHAYFEVVVAFVCQKARESERVRV